MGSLSTIEIIYIIFLFGSFAFGLEAMFAGFGGKLLLLFHRRRGITFSLTLGLGLAVVSLGIATSVLFNLEPIYFAVLVILFSLVVGRVVGAFSKKFVESASPPPLPKSIDEEIKKIVSARGYRNLLEKSGKRMKKVHGEKG